MRVLKDRCINCITFTSPGGYVKHHLLDSQVNVLLDAEAKVAIVGEVLLPQLILLNLEAPLQDLLSLIVSVKLVEKPLKIIVRF